MEYWYCDDCGLPITEDRPHDHRHCNIPIPGELALPLPSHTPTKQGATS